jgi:hypothetical protein
VPTRRLPGATRRSILESVVAALELSESAVVRGTLEPLCVAGRYSAALTVAPSFDLTAEECFYLALAAFAGSDLPAATAYAGRASQLAPADAVLAAACVYLERVRAGGMRAVYLNPAGFSAFIRGGSNQRLYRATSAALRSVYAGLNAATLLDIGVGDGMALLPALDEHIARVIAVEPSGVMLEKTANELRRRGVRFEAIPQTIQEYAERTHTLQCDVAQATFSLQSLAPAARARIWPWLRQHARRVLVAEFDVPNSSVAFSARWVAHVLGRYRRGLAEYAGEPLVIQEFLMPVMFGYFDPTATRTNYEQSSSDWAAEARAGGFTNVLTELLDDYWWAPAYLFDVT